MSSGVDVVSPSLTADDARRLLLGLPSPREEQAAAAAPESGRPPAPGYERCHGCRIIQPCLLTFATPFDWWDDLKHPEAVHAAVQAMRNVTGRRTILLCQWCVEDRDITPPEPPR